MSIISNFPSNKNKQIMEIIDTKQNTLTGTTGQVVGFGADGTAQTVPGWSNPNLLINADFRNPVNRNGKTSYSGGGPTIDGWQAYAGAPVVSLEDGAIKFSKGDWGQPLRIKGILPGTYTMSALASGGNFAAFSFSIPAGSGPATYYFDIPGTNLRMTFAYKWIVQSHLFYLTNNSDADDARAIAAKLERGPTQTLAHQDADGNWVLNDPPDYDLQYALCSLYSPITGEWVGSQHSNPNLLDNWYFADPVNQRGQAEYTNAGYTIDRWKIVGSLKVTLHNGFTRIEGSGARGNYDQVIETEFENDTVITYSFFILSGSGKICIRDVDWGDYGSASINGAGLYSVTSTFPAGKILMAQIYSDGDFPLDLIVAKLELGPQQTLAHQDADGNWVLNDPPPNKALELAKCQRYFVRFDSKTVNNASIFIGTATIDGLNSNTKELGGQGFIVLPAAMRTTPTLSGNVNIFNSGLNKSGLRIHVLGVTGNLLRINWTLDNIETIPTTRIGVLWATNLSVSADL